MARKPAAKKPPKAKAGPTKAIVAAEPGVEPEVPETEPIDLPSILDEPTRIALERAGISIDKIRAELEAWKARHPGQVPLAQFAENLMNEHLNPTLLKQFAKAVILDAFKTMFEGKGPVAHSGSELV